MPKTGVTDSEWKHRLEQYALGACQFHRVQRPGKFSQWANELAKIEKCPLHWNIHGVILLGGDLHAPVDIIRYS